MKKRKAEAKYGSPYGKVPLYKNTHADFSQLAAAAPEPSEGLKKIGDYAKVYAAKLENLSSNDAIVINQGYWKEVGYGSHVNIIGEYSIGPYAYASVDDVLDAKPEPSLNSELDRASFELPGIREEVDYPCNCSGGRAPLRSVIMHLNDAHSSEARRIMLPGGDMVYEKLSPELVWSRERIADWLDELHDDGQINIEFAPWSEELTVKELEESND